MNTQIISIQKQKAESSNVAHPNHQLQLSEDKNKDRHHEAKAKGDYFEPAAQQRRLHGKAAVIGDHSLNSNQNYTGYTRLRERVHGFDEHEEASNVCFKRTKGNKESSIPRLTAGSKDRHCKVPTSKGLRDRRVRLSANTAIEFYDVQDRLGFDRASNAIDWLMKEAEAAICALGKDLPLAQLPHYVEKEIEEINPPNQTPQQIQLQSKFLNPDEYSINRSDQHHFNDNPDNNFSFVPLLCGSTSSTSVVAFPNYQHGFDPRIIRNQNQDFCLTLQSFQDDPTILQQNLSPYSLAGHDNSVSSSSTPINFNTSANPRWFQKVTTNKNSNSKVRVLDSIDGHSEQFLEQNNMCFQGESIQPPTFIPSTNSSLSKTDYDWMPLLNRRTGLVYNEISNSVLVRGQGETTKPVSSVSSSATNAFLHYQDYQNQE